MSKLPRQMLDIDLDVVMDYNDHAVMREDHLQTFRGVKTFNEPPQSLVTIPFSYDQAVTKEMLLNATQGMNKYFQQTLVVTEEDISNGYVKLSKEIPAGKETSLEIEYFAGAPLMVNSVDFGAETDRLVLTGYPIEHIIEAGDEIDVKYMAYLNKGNLRRITFDSDIENITYSRELERFVCITHQRIYWSDDAQTWTEAYDIELDEFGYEESLGLVTNHCAYSPKSGFVAYSHNDDMGVGGLVFFSSDGKNWDKSEITAPDMGYLSIDSNVFWCNAFELFVTLQVDLDDNLCLFTSEDGITWKKHSILAENGDFEYGSNVLLWDEQQSTLFVGVRDAYIYFGATDDYCISDNSPSRLLASTDLVHWNVIDKTDTQAYAFGDSPIFSPMLNKWVSGYEGNEVYDSMSGYYNFTGLSAIYEYNTTQGMELYGKGVDIPACVLAWFDGVNVFFGHNSAKETLFSHSGFLWCVIPDLTMEWSFLHAFCWAKDKDMLLVPSGDDGKVLQIVENFSSYIAENPRINLQDMSAYDYRDNYIIGWSPNIKRYLQKTRNI